MYAVLELLHFLSNLSKNIATEALKKQKRDCLMVSFSVFSVPQWQKRYTLQGDFTTAYISNQYQQFDKVSVYMFSFMVKVAVKVSFAF